MASLSEVRARKDLLEALAQRLRSETTIPDTLPGKKGMTIDQRHLNVDLVTLIHVKEIDMMLRMAVELAVNMLIVQIVLVTISLATYDINLHSNILQST